ncbi:ABC transporter ATP-binding protein [Variovorax sp. WS11]|uniref:ABC transporter ATP-binding protein n=1 Tax=Variovorax sp. WS11 TaxID=1105204 RepID=UPI001C62F9F7|nr:ABC transporter ATP-binding protein [Variovorax sp. WS11]
MSIKLTVRDLHAGYGAVRALMGVSLNLNQGETVALLGTNGNGKSTLLKCLMGMVKPTHGEIALEVDGCVHNLVGMPTQEIVGLGIAMVPEGRRLFGRMSVEENLLLGAFRPLARPCIARSLEFCFETFPVLKDRRHQLAETMSGGQQQMLAIARALMGEPRILLVDEPSVGLSPLLVSQAIQSIGALKESRELSVLMAEQNFQQAVRIADRGYLIVHGQIVFEGRDVAELTQNDLIRARYLGLSE